MQVAKINFGNEQQTQNSRSVLPWAAGGAVAGGAVGAGSAFFFGKPSGDALKTDEFAKAVLKSDASKLNEVADALGKEGAKLADEQRTTLEKFGFNEKTDVNDIRAKAAILNNDEAAFKLAKGSDVIEKLNGLIETPKDEAAKLKGDIAEVLKNEDNQKLFKKAGIQIEEGMNAETLAERIKTASADKKTALDDAAKDFAKSHTDEVGRTKTTVTAYLDSIKDKADDVLKGLKEKSNGLAARIDETISSVRKGKMWKWGGLGAAIGAAVLGAYAYFTSSKEV